MSKLELPFEIPEEVDQTLHELAAKAGVDPDQYVVQIFSLFVQFMIQNPAWRVRIAKLGLDTLRLAEDQFAEFVRKHAGDIALDLQIAAAAEPAATPQQRAAAIRAWANHPRHEMPILSDADLSRESIYGGSG